MKTEIFKEICKNFLNVIINLHFVIDFQLEFDVKSQNFLKI